MTGLLVVAVEASADAHGASVLRELRSLVPDVRAFGAGGPRLRAEGCETLVRAEDLSVMGFVEVIPAIPRLFRALGTLRRAAEERRPRAALLIDSPDFNLRLARRLRALGIPVVYFIGPTVWAWRRYRIRQIARDVMRMLVILPFEAAFYARGGVQATYVGNPVADAVRVEAASRSELRRAL
ncbi:MAG: lipid-A-disaccharide synthase, partial [Myxococcales bacterium]